MAKKWITVTLRLTQEEHDNLKEYAEKNRRSFASTMRYAFMKLRENASKD